MSKVIGEWRNTWKCALCGEEHEGWGSNPAPLLDYNSALVCPECNQIVVAFRMLLIRMGEKTGIKRLTAVCMGKSKNMLRNTKMQDHMWNFWRDILRIHLLTR